VQPRLATPRPTLLVVAVVAAFHRKGKGLFLLPSHLLLALSFVQHAAQQLAA